MLVEDSTHETSGLEVTAHLLDKRKVGQQTTAHAKEIGKIAYWF
jgi:hypothetical protein